MLKAVHGPASLAARRRCYYKEPALRLGLAQGRKGMAYAQARRAATNGRAEHKRLLCQQGSAATKQTAAHGALRHQQPYKGHRRIGSQCQSRKWHVLCAGQGPTRSSAGSIKEACKSSTGWTAAKRPARASKAALKGSVEPRSSRCSGTVFGR